MANNQGNKMSTRNGISTGRSPLPGTIEGDDADDVFLFDVQRNANQTSGRVLETSWQVNVDEAARLKCHTSSPKGSACIVNNYGIVASRGELARNKCTARKASAPCIVSKKSKAISNSSSRAKRRDNFLGEELSAKLLLEDIVDPKDFKISQRPARNFFSVPTCLREGVSREQKGDRNATEGSILKRSSVFLASLAHSASRIKAKPQPSHYCVESDCLTNYPSLREYCSILTNVTTDFDSLRRSASVRTLPTERRKKTVCRVKKSVSFSSDTSFEEKRKGTCKRAAVHEVQVYHKGVLQDRCPGEVFVGKVPSSWETAPEGRSALLRAARDADNTVLGEIAAQVRKFGFRDTDVNMADSSGRTAISYMAGNGATSMLELTLSSDGVDPNIPDNEGNTPLHFAAQAGQTECLNVLLERCSDIELDARNAAGFTPLMKAALQGRTKCAKILLFAGANPTLRDHGRGLRAEQWARFCGRYVCADVIERFARHRLLERSTSCRWGSEPELAAKVLQGKVMPIPTAPLSPPCSGFKSKIRRVFRTTSGPDRSFSLVSQLTSAALCASSPALPKSSDVPPVVKSLLRPLSVPQLRVTLVPSQDFFDQSKERYGLNLSEKIESTIGKPSRSKKKAK